MRFIQLLIVLIGTSVAFGQPGNSDSLASFIKTHAKDDTLKVNALNELSNHYLWIDFYSSIRYADEALAISRQLGYEKGMATANNLKGFCYWAFGDNELAIEKGLEAYALAEKGKSETLKAESDLILSRAYMDQNEGKNLLSI
jgi:hypothetical protein